MQLEVINQVVADKYAVYNGDCVEISRGIPDNSIHYTIFSPPFEGLYTYSDSLRDTRGTLFFEIIRFASILGPEHLLLENVEGLLNHDKGKTFETVLGALDEMGYDCEWQVHNSASYVPQNRERIFIVGHSRGVSTRKVFPFGRENSKAIEVAR